MSTLATTLFDALLKRAVSDHATEEDAKALFMPTKVFTLSCIYAELLVDSFLWYGKYGALADTSGVYTMMLVRYLYLQSKKADPWWIWIIVLAVTCLTYLLTAYNIWFISSLFVQHFGQYRPFFESAKLSWFPLIDAIVSGITQGFFAHRAFMLNGRNWIIVLLVAGLICLAFISSTAVKINFQRAESTTMAHVVNREMMLWVSSTMAADVIITGSILWGLYKSRTGWNHTDRLITRLIRLTLEAQVPPLVIAMAFVIEFTIAPSSYLGATFQGVQGKLYAIGLLYSLNVREFFARRGGMMTIDRNDPPAFGISGHQQTTIHVEVETEMYASPVNYPPVQGVNRRIAVDLEKIEDAEEDATHDGASCKAGSIASKVRLTPPTPPSHTPSPSPSPSPSPAQRSESPRAA